MFKKLKEKITEEVKSSPQRFAEFTQSVSDRLQNSSTSDDNFFSIAEDDHNTSTNSSNHGGFSSVSLVSPSQETRSRKLSNSSMASDVSFLPRYESGNMYHLQSDLDISASEIEDNASSSSQLGHLSKEQIYSAFQKSQMRYHKYRGRYTDLARHYKELERENSKMKSVLVETQDKALRRVKELREQCNLEQEAKAHLEMALRDEMDEKTYKIKTLQTKIELLQNDDSHSSSLVSTSDIKECENIQSENDIENLTKYLNDARKEIEALTEKIQELKANAIVYQSKDEENKSKMSALEKEITQYVDREKENNLKFAQYKMELHNELISKENEVTKMKKDMEILRQKLEVVESESKLGNNAKIDNLQSQNKKLIEKVENFTQKCNILENESLKVNSFKIEIENAKKREIDLTKQLEVVQNTNATLVEENNNLQKTLSSYQQHLESLKSELKKQTEEYEQRIAHLREDAQKGLLTLEPKIREKLLSEFQAKEQKLLEQLQAGNDQKVKFFETEKLSEELRLKDEFAAKIEAYNNLEKNHLELIDECTKLRGEMENLTKERKSLVDNDDRVSRLEAHIKTLQDELQCSKAMAGQKEDVIVYLSKENTTLQQELDETKEKLRLFESKYENISLDGSENKLLELEAEKENMIKQFEMERAMLLKDHKELKERQNDIHVLEKDLKECQNRIEHLEKSLNDEITKNANLYNKKIRYKEENVKLMEKIRLLEERQEADDINRFECGLLEMKLKKMEDDRQSLMQSFDQERELFEKHLEEIHRDLDQNIVDKDNVGTNEDKLKRKIADIKRICANKEQEILYLSKENENIIQQNEHLSQKLRLLEEKCETLQLQSNEAKLFELKYRNLEQENEKLVAELEMERKMFAALLENHKDIEDKNKTIENVDNQFHSSHEELLELREQLEKCNKVITDKDEDRLELEERLKESKRILEDKEEIIALNKHESHLSEMKLQKIGEKEDQMQIFEKERKEFEETCAKKNEELKMLNARIEGMLKEYHDKTLEHKEESKKLNEKIKLLEEHYHQFKVDSETEKDALIVEIEEKDRQVGELSQKISHLSEVIEKQTEDFNNLLKWTQELDGIMSTANRENMAAIKKEKQRQNELITQVEQLQKELVDKSAELQQMNQKLCDVEQLYQQEQLYHKNKQQEIEILNRKLHEMEVFKETYEAMINEKQRMDDDIVKLQMVAKEKISLENKLKDIEHEMKTHVNNLRIKEQECFLLRNERDALMEEMGALRMKLSELNDANNAMKEAAGQSTDLQLELRQVHGECDTLRQAKDKLDLEMSELANRLKQLSTDNANAMYENQTLLTEKEELKIRLEMFVNEKSSDYEEMEKTNKHLSEKLDTVTQQLNDVQKQNIELINQKVDSNELSVLQKNFYDIKEKCDSLSMENKNLKTEYDNLDVKCNEYMRNKELLENQIKELESHYTEIMHEKQLLQDEVHELKISPVNHHQLSTNNKLDSLNILKKEQHVEINNDIDKQHFLREIEILHDKLTKYKSLDLTNKSSIEFYENELQKMKNQNDKLNRKLDETLVTLNHCAELSSSSTEVEYLRNVLYNYMLGKESLVLARVIAAVCKFDPEQTDLILQKEQQKQTLLGQLGLI